MESYPLTEKIIITSVENGYIIEVHRTTGPVLQYVANEATAVRDLVWNLVPKG